MNSAYDGPDMGFDGTALFLVYRDPHKDFAVSKVWSGIVGEKGIKPDTWYRLNEKGKPVVVKE